MDDAIRLERQKRYLEICQEKGWLSAHGVELWPENDDARTEMARGLFGLAVMSDTDNLFADTRTKIGADGLAASSDVDGVPH